MPNVALSLCLHNQMLFGLGIGSRSGLLLPPLQPRPLFTPHLGLQIIPSWPSYTHFHSNPPITSETHTMGSVYPREKVSMKVGISFFGVQNPWEP